MTSLIIKWAIACAVIVVAATPLHAQLDVSAQLRMRSELRDGQGSPLPKGAKAAFFTSQRSRVNLGYKNPRLQIRMALQDVRVWGQDVSTINRNTTAGNNAFMLHEAWAELLLSDSANNKSKFLVKAGRQELVYDDQRLLGNLDWLQQARRHDALVIKLQTRNYSLHGGVAFNQNSEKNAGTLYNATPPGSYGGNTNAGSMYKSFEYLHASKSFKSTSLSLLFFSDQFTKFHMVEDNEVITKHWDAGVWNRYTTGLYLVHAFNSLQVTAAAYYQGGKNPSGIPVSAGLLSLSSQLKLSEKFSIGPGADYTSGGSSQDKSSVFDPLYGTPHKFWGLMDYFYAGSAFGNTGLMDVYLKSSFQFSDRWVLNGDVHQFGSASTVNGPGAEKISRTFGTEVDFVLRYKVSAIVQFETGYSHFFSKPGLSSANVKNVVDARQNHNWAYLSLNITPVLLSR